MARIGTQSNPILFPKPLGKLFSDVDTPGRGFALVISGPKWVFAGVICAVIFETTEMRETAQSL